ncbi:MAG: hydroxyphenylacetyl-CoA thioesterase PaaI, partial [Pseudomonadota bacterium]
MAGKDELAARVAEHMYAEDRASSGLGMVIDEIRLGYAKLSMTVRPDMVNGHKLCHGGFIFTLADSAFAFACNSYNHSTVAASAEISFLKPAFEGERLEAVAEERWREGRNGIYDIQVTNGDGVTIA